MSYIELINTAWEMREQGLITAHEHDLYNYLLHKCNRLNWKSTFNQSTEVICAVLGINRNALASRRNKLRQLGLITFKEGVARSRPAEYSLTFFNPFQEDPLPTDLAVKKFQRKSNEVGKKKQSIRQVKSTFKKPSVDELVEYCTSRSNSVDARLFFDFYESKNWMIGRNKMKDWKAAIRTWEKNNIGTKHSSTDHDNGKAYEKF